MRFALAGLAHETNTFATAMLGRTAYEAFAVARGAEIVDRHAGTRTYLGGMIDAVAALDGTPAPALHAIAEPSGVIAAEAYVALRDEIVERLRRAGPVDAVALELHGAAVAEGFDDVETELVLAVREVVGRTVPIGACLDLHANLTPELVAALDFVVGVRFYPHVDMYERGYDVVQALAAIAGGTLSPASALVQVPMLLPTTTTDLEPAAGIAEMCRDLAARPGLAACTFFHGFPAADVPFAGASVLVTADSDPEAAGDAASALARHVWDLREELLPLLTGAPEAVAAALSSPDRPVVVAETADNPGGGAPGDATHLLRALLATTRGSDGARTCFASVFDPATVDAATRAGVGSTVDVRLGGKHDRAGDEPIEASAYVRCITDGRIRLKTPMGRGRTVDMGPSTLLRIDGVDVVVCSERGQVWDAELFRLHGIDVRDYDVVGVKGSVHFRAGFAGIAAAVVVADTPGLISRDLHARSYERLRRPCWPLDPDTPFPLPSLAGGAR